MGLEERARVPAARGRIRGEEKREEEECARHASLFARARKKVKSGVT